MTTVTVKGDMVLVSWRDDKRPSLYCESVFPVSRLMPRQEENGSWVLGHENVYLDSWILPYKFASREAAEMALRLGTWRT